jgi:O-antigen ligase
MAAGQATSAAARIVTYQQALSVIGDNPVLGVGWGSAVRAFEYEYRTTRSGAVGFVAENYFLQRGVALGLPGIVLFLLLCVLFFRNAILPRGEIPGPDWPRAAILIAGVAFYAQAQTFVAAQSTATYALWILFGLAERMRESLPQVKGTA